MAHNEGLEKRLRAVYDAFDQRNHKAAIKLCNAGLQKYPECYTFKSLKSVALERSGKRDEALQLADEVLAAAPPDDHVLNMLLLVLKPADRVHDVTAAYEAASSKQPGNEDLLQGLFACHVRSCSYTAQQQVAMKLNKLHPSELYQWWVLASLALQAHAAAVQTQLTAAAAAAADSSSAQAGTDGSSSQPAGAAAGGSGAGLGADKLLALAEAMAGRLLGRPPAQGGQHSWESVMMYLGLLQAQGKYDAALAAVRGPLDASFSLSAERREAEAAILMAKGDLTAAAGLYAQALQEQPDDWAVLLLYLDCMLPATASSLPACGSTAVAQMVTGVEASTRPGCQIGGLAALLDAMKIGDDNQPLLEERLAQAEAFVGSLASTAATDSSTTDTSSSSSTTTTSSSNSNAVLRGPALAQVELAKRKLQLGVGDEQQLVQALLQYHERFGHVVSCAMDIFCYLELLGSTGRQQLCDALVQRAQQAAAAFQRLQQQAPAEQASNKELLKLLRTHMSALQLQADAGVPRFTSPDAAAQHAQQLLQMYAAALPLYKGMDERERGPADELLWQAAAALVAAATLTHSSSSSSSGSSSSSSSSSAASIKYLLQAVLVLEAAAKGRPYCAPVRLGLTGLYGVLGNASGAAHHFSVMDVKHVQHDTLSSHHLLPLLLGLKSQQRTEALLKSTCALFEDHLVDAGDTLMQAYRNGTHTKVVEFVCFKERLERSHSFVLARAERAILSICSAAAAGAQGSAAAAVAAAVDALPLDFLECNNWHGMRFNDDLTTRLPWLPPIEGPRQLVVLNWWEQQRQQRTASTQPGPGTDAGTSSSGSSSSSPDVCCWWRQVAAAEADVPEAAALRTSMKAAAQQRWLLPHLLHAAQDAANTGGSTTPAPLQQLLAKLAVTQGYRSTLELDAAIQHAFTPDARAADVPLSKQLQLLDAALFMLSASLQGHLAAAQQPKALNGHAASSAAAAPGPTVQQCTASLSAGLTAVTHHFQQQLQPSEAYLGCVLPGHVLSGAVLLLSESCCWLELCLQAWSKALKQHRRKKGSKAAAATAAADQDPQHVEEAVQALSQLQTPMLALLQQLQDSTKSLLQAAVAAAAKSLLAEFDESSDAAVRALVGWEPRMSVQIVLVELLKQQRVMLEQIKDSSSKLHSRLSSISW